MTERRVNGSKSFSFGPDRYDLPPFGRTPDRLNLAVAEAVDDCPVDDEPVPFQVGPSAPHQPIPFGDELRSQFHHHHLSLAIDRHGKRRQGLVEILPDSGVPLGNGLPSDEHAIL